MKTIDKRSRKMDLRIALIRHPNPNRVIINHFNDVYKWNVAESQYWNVIVFLEIVRQNNLWDRLEKLLEE